MLTLLSMTNIKKSYPMSTSELSAWIRGIRKKLRLSQKEMAEKVGAKRTQYANWEYGQEPPLEFIKKFEDIEKKIVEEPSGLTFLVPRPTGTLKILGTIGALTEADGREMEELQSLPIEFCEPDFGGLICEGESMMPYLHPGDILVFREHQTPRLNRIFAVRRPDTAKLIVKKLVYEEETFKLINFNAVKREVDPVEGMQLIGYLVGIVSQDGAVKIGPVRTGIDEHYIDNQFRSRISIREL